MIFGHAARFVYGGNMKLRQYLGLVFIAGFAAGCSKGNDSETSGMASYSGTRTSIPLEAVQTEAGCLSAPLYTLALRQLRSDLPILEASTNIQLHNGRGMREAFRLLTAFGNFKFESKQGSERIDLHGISQDGCKSITHTAADGTREDFTITEARPDFISASSANGGRREYRWISPERVEIGTRHKALDLPCTSGQTMVDLKQVLDWSGSVPPVIGEQDPLYVEPAFVEMLASAVGTSVQDYYADIPTAPEAPGRKALRSDKLMELARSAVRQDLLVCTGEPPAPPVPEDPQDPQNPETPVDPVPPVEPVPPAPEEGAPVVPPEFPPDAPVVPEDPGPPEAPEHDEDRDEDDEDDDEEDDD